MLISQNHNNYKLNLIENHILFVNSYNFQWFSYIFFILLFSLHLLLPFLPFPLLLRLLILIMFLLLLLLLLRGLAGPVVAMWLENNVLLWFYYDFTMSLLWVNNPGWQDGKRFGRNRIELNHSVNSLTI